MGDLKNIIELNFISVSTMSNLITLFFLLRRLQENQITDLSRIATSGIEHVYDL